MSLQAYQKAAARAENPRQTEYRLLGQVTRALIDAQAAGRFELKTLSSALEWNRKVWSTFAADCSAAENELPEALRASIISLSIFVVKYTSQVLREGAELDPLIDINRTIMQGLDPHAAGS
ncbi:MAG: flagellar biosynthesis regulator FlaF [Caulobacterales bacterium]|nr:flagellar biosynthesis regulator FlaF [Caulobacterales bacterium]